MILIVISSNPLKSSAYIQGIEVALNICEAQEGCIEVVTAGAFNDAFLCADKNDDLVKRLRQLDLYEIPFHTTSRDFDDKITCVSLRDRVEHCNKVIVF